MRVYFVVKLFLTRYWEIAPNLPLDSGLAECKLRQQSRWRRLPYLRPKEFPHNFLRRYAYRRNRGPPLKTMQTRLAIVLLPHTSVMYGGVCERSEHFFLEFVRVLRISCSSYHLDLVTFGWLTQLYYVLYFDTQDAFSDG